MVRSLLKRKIWGPNQDLWNHILHINKFSSYSYAHVNLRSTGLDREEVMAKDLKQERYTDILLHGRSWEMEPCRPLPREARRSRKRWRLTWSSRGKSGTGEGRWRLSASEAGAEARGEVSVLAPPIPVPMEVAEFWFCLPLWQRVLVVLEFLTTVLFTYLLRLLVFQKRIWTLLK